jgi:hypothetical protein
MRHWTIADGGIFREAHRRSAQSFRRSGATRTRFAEAVRHGRDPECPPDELSWPHPQTPSWERLEIVLTQIGGAGGVGAAGAYARA